MKQKNKFGQYFTLPQVARFMTDMITHDTSVSVLEPSCGKGVFIRTLQEKGFQNITAYEIDKSLSTDYQCVRYESFVSSPLEKFDVVIGNPPYIRWKNLEAELKTELAENHLWKTYFNSLCDYLFIFILKSIEQLNINGELIFICTEYWMNTTHSISLRNYMIRNGYFSDIYHFKETSLFEGVTASFIIFRYVKSSINKPKIRLHHYIGNKKVSDILTEKDFTTEQISQFEDNKRWILANDNIINELHAYEKKCYSHDDITLFQENNLCRIGDVCDIGNGMVSGMDKAFKIQNISSLNEFEKSFVIKVYKAKDLHQYYNINESFYALITNIHDEMELKKLCPNLYQQLSAFKNELLKRYDYGKELNYWHFAFTRNKQLFQRQEDRIFVPCKERISNKDYFRFVLAGKDVMPLQDVTAIFKKSSCLESIEYILALLNNHRVYLLAELI